VIRSLLRALEFKISLQLENALDGDVKLSCFIWEGVVLCKRPQRFWGGPTCRYSIKVPNQGIDLRAPSCIANSFCFRSVC